MTITKPACVCDWLYTAMIACYTLAMSKRHKLLWQAVRRALLILADAIKAFIDTADEPEPVQ
jgi:hypothetical protein